MKTKLITLLIVLMAGSLWAMPPAADFSDYFGEPEDPVTYIGAIYYDNDGGLMVNGGLTVPLGRGFYTIPSFQTGDENTEGTVELVWTYGIGKGWYLGAIITPFGLNWSTDIPNNDIDYVAYVKCGAGVIAGKALNDYVGLGAGAKYKRTYDTEALFANNGWQVGAYLTISL